MLDIKISLLFKGANSHGQLGHGHTSEQCIFPDLVEFDFSSDIAKISGGGGHVLVLDASGNLYSTGWNSKGQLGDGTIQNRSRLTPIPKSVFNGNPVESIACGWDVSAAVCRNGLAYVWGSNAYNQFGIPNTKVLFSSKIHRLELPKNEKIKTVVFSLRSTCVLTDDGTVYIFGKSRQVEELHQNKQFTSICFNDVNYFRFNSTVDQISAGQNHFLCLSTSQKDLLGFGDNKFAQSESINLTENVTCLKSGWTHNGALTENRNLYLWGRNNYGQVGKIYFVQKDIILLNEFVCVFFFKE